MKILSITAQKPHSTGSGTYLTELVRSWARQGHEQAVVCGIYTDDAAEFPAGVSCFPVYYCSEDGLPFPITGMSDIMPYESTRYRDLTPEMIARFEQVFIEAVTKAVDALDPDLIVCHHLFLLTAMVRRHFPDRRILGISHGTDLRQMINVPLIADMIRGDIARLDGILALHSDQKQQIQEIFGVPDARVRVIGSGYNSAIFNTHGRQPRVAGSPVRICCAGKMSRPKGVPEMLAVLSRLSSDPDVPAFEVTLAGGCRDDYVQGLLDDLPDNISYLGQIPQLKLAEVFRSNDIFVLPSYFEGLPLVLIEAMASGMVPVSTDLPGVRPWIDENVPGSNVVYVPMPEMASVDEPTEAGRVKFTVDLFDALRSVIISITGTGDSPSLPDTSWISWDGVAQKILTGL